MIFRKASECPALFAYGDTMKKEDSTWRYLGLVSQLGITIIVSLLLMTFLGMWLDKVFGTNFIAAVLAVLGLLGGMTGAYSLIRKEIKKDGPKEETYDLMEGFKDSEEKDEEK